MHPKALLEACTELITAVLKFDAPADNIVSFFLRQHRELGPRERHTLAETAYSVLRRRLLYQHLAQSGSGPGERRLAIIGWAGDAAFLRAALELHEQKWLAQVQAIDRSTLAPKLRHNLPDWIAQPLQSQLGDEGFWALVASLDEAAPLDLRVNVLKTKRDAAQTALAAAGIEAALTPYSPWGLRIQGRPALQKLPLFTGGEVEVQDEGSQLLALLTDAKRGEMVVDFCAGAGGRRWRWARRCATPVGCMPSTWRATASKRSSRGWRAAGCPTSTRCRLRMSATSASSAWLARSIACWSTRRARAWARCAATPT